MTQFRVYLTRTTPDGDQVRLSVVVEAKSDYYAKKAALAEVSVIGEGTLWRVWRAVETKDEKGWSTEKG